MQRTANRPLPSGRMDPQIALAFGVVLASLSLPALLVGANPLTAVLGLLALLSYVGVYTPLKSRSSIAMLAGAVPGALPPLMGWTAVTHAVTWPGLALFGILFFWQLPHFLAIALFRKEEYRAAGLTTVPLEHGDVTARRQLVGYLVVLVVVSFSLYPLGVAGAFYAVGALLLGALYLAHAVRGLVQGLGAGWARQNFFLSLVYISGLFLALMLDGVARL
jgi:protoheme IX farnesyltransferase